MAGLFVVNLFALHDLYILMRRILDDHAIEVAEEVAIGSSAGFRDQSILLIISCL